jgi:hypothetical protein
VGLLLLYREIIKLAGRETKRNQFLDPFYLIYFPSFRALSTEL